MPLRNQPAIFAVLISCLILPATMVAQESCPAPASLTTSAAEPNLFTPEQEMVLGDLFAQQFERDYAVIDTELNDYLQKLVERLAQQLPRSGLRFRVVLIDLPTVNSFTLPGGRIYVTRKLVAAAASEDELAGVLAHELGHAVTRQPSLDVSRILQKALGVNSVGDRADIAAKYHLMEESAWRRKIRIHDEREEQAVADQVAIYAVTRAGYIPQAYSDFWDRTTEVHGKTGNWLGDLFGATRPEAKRLREMLKYAAELPKSCAGAPMHTDKQFSDWRRAVLELSPSDAKARPEDIPGLLKRVVLDPPLRTQIEYLHFSPDGKYILAQDDASIIILTTQTFKEYMKISARDAYHAQFSPDSRFVTFGNSNLRVERWSLEGKRRVQVNEVHLRSECIASSVSPLGDLIGCFTPENELLLIDVNTSQPVYRHKDIIPSDLPGIIIWAVLALQEDRAEALNMQFSPDGNYFGIALGSIAEIVDTRAKSRISIPGRMRDLMRLHFTFLPGGHFIGIDENDGKKSDVLDMSGHSIIRVQLNDSNHLQAASTSDFLVLHPLGEKPGGAIDLRTGKILFGYPRAAMDLHGSTVVTELNDGTLAQFNITDLQAGPKAIAELPKSDLGFLKSFALTPDFHYLAASAFSRGAVWDLQLNKRLYHVKGFSGAIFEGSSLFADFPKDDPSPRRLGVMSVDGNSMFVLRNLEEKKLRMYGPYLLVPKQKQGKKQGDDGKDVAIEIRETKTNKVLWSREFADEFPRIFVNSQENRLILEWDGDDHAVKKDLKSDPVFEQRLGGSKLDHEDYVFHVLEFSSGKLLGKVAVRTGKGAFLRQAVTAAADDLVFVDRDNRALVYSISTGELKGRAFGSYPVLSSAAGIMALENGGRTLTLYSMDGAHKFRDIDFPSSLTAEMASADGKRLFVLTEDQVAYVLDVDRLKKPDSAEKAENGSILPSTQ